MEPLNLTGEIIPQYGGGAVKIDFYTLISQACNQVESQFFTYLVTIFILYLLSNLIENKIRRGKWFKDSDYNEKNGYGFNIPIPIFKKNYPFIDIELEFTDMKMLLSDWIVPIMKMLIYALLIYLISIAKYSGTHKLTGF